ncbi:MAG TPA: ATP-binding protein [Burkholderiales bacterium]|nr:ATP-binding protein [Burkholderiales bacterium]
MNAFSKSGPGARSLLPALTIRVKLALVTLVLLVIPWVGYKYVKTMEHLLRENQVQAVVATARAVAAALQDRPRLLEMHASDGTATATPRPASEEIQLLMTGLARAGSRIWVVDRRLQLVAVAGSLDTAQVPVSGNLAFGPVERGVRALVRVLFESAQGPAPPAEEVIPNDVVFGGREIERALDGTSSWRLRPASDGRTAILTAVNPVWGGDTVVGAVVVEETTQAILSFSNRALEQLAAVTLIAFAAGALALFAFASSLSSRLRRLRDEAENAIDSQGRVRSLVAGERARDEIGDLSRGFSTVLERLAQYNDYLEHMASRLSHELRTPIAVVRSSLDNLRLQPVPDDAKIYVERANEGLNRLDTILTRMSEATRLEQLVREGERERFNARAVLAGCISGYAGIYPRRRFELATGETPVMLNGAPDLFAQMLDKLAANAVDFSSGEDTVKFSLEQNDNEAVLILTNSGALLPAEMQGRLFESMISMRPRSHAGEPHLGLGLYIVRMIAEFHGGRVAAHNRPDGSGVVFELHFPVAG